MNRPHGLCAGRIDRAQTFKGVKFEVLVGTGEDPYPVRAVTHMIDADTGQHIIYDPWAASQLREQLTQCAALLESWAASVPDGADHARCAKETPGVVESATALLTDIAARDVPGGEDHGR